MVWLSGKPKSKVPRFCSAHATVADDARTVAHDVPPRFQRTIAMDVFILKYANRMCGAEKKIHPHIATTPLLLHSSLHEKGSSASKSILLQNAGNLSC